jgi:hypothetical protein
LSLALNYPLQSEKFLLLQYLVGVEAAGADEDEIHSMPLPVESEDPQKSNCDGIPFDNVDKFIRFAFEFLV